MLIYYCFHKKMPLFINMSRKLLFFFRFTIIILTAQLLFTGYASAEFENAYSVFRIKPSSPEQLLTKIFNSALVGSDRLEDIETYMSKDLKKAYKKARNNIVKGKTCDVPRILSNKYFTGKLYGFTIQPVKDIDAGKEVTVVIDTGSAHLPDTSEFKRFNPAIYESIRFNFKRQFLEWKINNISMLQPQLEGEKQGEPSYKKIDLMEILTNCK